ncbi:membrane protein [Carboxydothermus pertinax]|uniref:Membrane protein n=1 Tax=Carboxydothermus pertinax TaxID=870242 RepID=A0A1L8CTM3_9THEO|nr:membrane protein [Carboxydothermus pertinax]
MEREKNLRFRLASFFLSFSVKDIKKPKNQRLRPWLFPRSNLLFKKRTPQNGLVELGIKAVLRDNQSLKEYFQVLLLCVLIVVTVPVNLKGLVLLALAFIWVNYVGLYWQEITKAPFLQMFAWKREDKALALQKFLFLMSLPGVLLLSLIVGYQTFAWIGTLLVIPISIVLVFYLCKFVTFYLLLKN